MIIALCSFLKSAVSSITPLIAFAILNVDCLSDSSASIRLSTESISAFVFSIIFCTKLSGLSLKSWNKSAGSICCNRLASTVSQISFQVEPLPNSIAALINSFLILNSPSALTTLQRSWSSSNGSSIAMWCSPIRFVFSESLLNMSNAVGSSSIQPFESREILSPVRMETT